jgi:hypothetical protein
MEHLTVQFTARPLNWSPSKRKYAGDPVSFVDGNYVGHDGFIVPRDFPEFYVRFPQYIRRWVRRHADKSASKEDIEDWTQELCVHMSSLPSTSQYRKAGKQDVIQTFDPFRHYGANRARFQNYINLCLANKFRTIHSARIKSPLCHAERLFLSEKTSDGVCIYDGFCELVSEQLLVAAERSHKQLQDRLFVGEFIEFVRRGSPRILSALEAIAVTRTQEEAARRLRMTNADFGRLCTQLRELGQAFVRGEQRSQQRGQSSVRSQDFKCDVATQNSSSPPLNTRSWDRVELYNEVWKQPIVKIARKCGISDVALGKACRKLRIPHPGRGDWAKRTAGKAVRQAPLPEFRDAPCREATQGNPGAIKSACWSSEALITGGRRAIGCVGATEFALKFVSDTRPMS